jgi:hypothetical protein
MNFLEQLFSDNPGVSFGRAATAWLIVAVTVWIGFFLYVNQKFPDPITIAALNALALSPYTVGKGMGKAAEILGQHKAEAGPAATEGVRPAGGSQKAEG